MSYLRETNFSDVHQSTQKPRGWRQSPVPDQLIVCNALNCSVCATSPIGQNIFYVGIDARLHENQFDGSFPLRHVPRRDPFTSIY